MFVGLGTRYNICNMTLMLKIGKMSVAVILNIIFVVITFKKILFSF